MKFKRARAHTYMRACTKCKDGKKNNPGARITALSKRTWNRELQRCERFSKSGSTFSKRITLQASRDVEHARLPEFLTELDLSSLEASEEDVEALKKIVKRLAPEKNGEYQVYQGSLTELSY